MDATLRCQTVDGASRRVLASALDFSDVCAHSEWRRAMPVTEVTHIDHETSQWDDAFYAFLAEKERRSGSLRTVQSYSRMLQHLFAELRKSPDLLTSPDVFGWAHGVGLSGRPPSSVTVGARIA